MPRMPTLNPDAPILDLTRALSGLIPLAAPAPEPSGPDQWQHDFMEAAVVAGFSKKQTAFMWQWLARFVVPAE